MTLEKAINQCKANESLTNQANLIISKKEPQCDAVKNTNTNKTFDCRRCGTNHGPKSCPAYKKRCEKCQRMGHLAAVCRSKKEAQKKSDSQKAICETAETSSKECDIEADLYLLSVTKTKGDDWFEMVTINNQQVNFKLDSGAQCNLISMKLAKQLKLQPPTSKTSFHTMEKRPKSLESVKSAVSSRIVRIVMFNFV